MWTSPHTRRALARVPTRLAGFALLLVAVGGGAAAIGRAVDVAPPLTDCLESAAAAAGLETGDAAHTEGGEPMVEPVPGADGLSSELAGLRIQPQPQSFASGRAATWRFRIVDCDGNTIRGFEPEQGKLLHLIVVRSDFTGYQHLHPALQRSGLFSTRIAFREPGRYRAIVDFVIDGRKYVVGTDLLVPGAAVEAPMSAPALSASTSGYGVELQRPAVLEAAEEAQLTFRITRRGRPVRDLEPYLGAYGHLVALRAPDLAYSHVHPDGQDPAAGAITFAAEFEKPGRYRLFLQFKTGGRVHTVAFTQIVR